MSEDARAGVRRRLAAILVAGYSRLFPGEEKEHFAGLRAFLTGVIEPQIAEFGGNIFKETAELVLAEFDSVVKAAWPLVSPNKLVTSKPCEEIKPAASLRGGRRAG